jgi:hypothetical protein
VQHPLVIARDSSLINKVCSNDPSNPREKLLFSLSSCSVESILWVVFAWCSPSEKKVADFDARAKNTKNTVF